MYLAYPSFLSIFELPTHFLRGGGFRSWLVLPSILDEVSLSGVLVVITVRYWCWRGLVALTVIWVIASITTNDIIGPGG